MRRIEAVEKDLKALADNSATKDDISRVRAEMKKLYDGLHVGKLQLLAPSKPSEPLSEFLDLRSHVWGIRESFIFVEACSPVLIYFCSNRTRSSCLVEKRVDLGSHLMSRIYLAIDPDFYQAGP